MPKVVGKPTRMSKVGCPSGRKEQSTKPKMSKKRKKKTNDEDTRIEALGDRANKKNRDSIQ